MSTNLHIILDKIDDIKEKLQDNEYIQIADLLMKEEKERDVLECRVLEAMSRENKTDIEDVEYITLLSSYDRLREDHIDLLVENKCLIFEIETIKKDRELSDKFLAQYIRENDKLSENLMAMVRKANQ